MARGTIKREQINTEGAGNIATDMEVAQMVSGSFPPGLFFESFSAQVSTTTNRGIEGVNRIKIRPIYLPFRIKVSKIYFVGDIINLDYVHDFGLYNNVGKLLLHTFLPVPVSVGLNIINISVAKPPLILPGIYYIAFTSSSTKAQLKSCATLLYDHQIPKYGYMNNIGGKTLPNEVNLNSIIESKNPQPWILFT